MREKPYTNFVHQQGTEYGHLTAFYDFSKRVLIPKKAMPAAIVSFKKKNITFYSSFDNLVIINIS